LIPVGLVQTIFADTKSAELTVQQRQLHSWYRWCNW